MTLTPNSVDGAIFFILFVFAILAFLKGFIKDFFSTINLLLAMIASDVIGSMISKMIVKGGSSQMLVDLGVRFGVFVVILIICSMVSSKISAPLSKKIPNAVNQSLGFGFGFTKGYFILAFSFAIILSLYSNSSDDLPKDDKSKKEKLTSERIGPAWFKESKSYGILAVGANAIRPFIDHMMDQVRSNAAKGVHNDSGSTLDGLESIDNIIKTKKMYDQLLDSQDNKVVPPTERDKSGYTKVEKPKTASDTKTAADTKTDPKEESGQTKQELEKMKRLIEIMSN